MRTRIQRMRRTWRTWRIQRTRRILWIQRIRILIHIYIAQAILKVAWVIIIVNVGGLFLFNREVTVKISI